MYLLLFVTAFIIYLIVQYPSVNNGKSGLLQTRDFDYLEQLDIQSIYLLPHDFWGNINLISIDDLVTISHFPRDLITMNDLQNLLSAVGMAYWSHNCKGLVIQAPLNFVGTSYSISKIINSERNIPLYQKYLLEKLLAAKFFTYLPQVSSQQFAELFSNFRQINR